MASIESDAIEFGPSPLKKQKNEIDNEPRTEGDKDAEMDGEEDAEIHEEDDDSDGDDDDETDGEEDSDDDGDSDSEVDSVIDFEGDANGKTRVKYDGFDHHNDEWQRQLVRFYYQWEKSEGFEVEWRRLSYRFCAFPVVWKENLVATSERSDKVVKRLTLNAIDKHNRDEGRKLELVKILKANCEYANGQVLYITFSAKDLSSCDPEPSLFQTKVWRCREKIEVVSFRPRPTYKEIASVKVDPPCYICFPGKQPEFYSEPAVLYEGATNLV